MPTINEQLVAAGVPTSSHRSDLYALVTPESRAIVDAYQWKRNVTTFRGEIDGKQWFDIPFACDAFWRAVEERSKARRAANV